jgi:hypothetical protein
MKGHTFLYPLEQDSAFVTTHFGIRQSLVFVRYPNVPIGDTKANLQAAGYNQDIDFGVRIIDQLGISTMMSARVVSGADVQSALLQGATFSGAFQGGLVGRIMRLEDLGLQLSARFYGAMASGRSLTIGNLVRSVADDPTNPSFASLLQGGGKPVTKTLLSPTSSSGFGGSLHAAQAFNASFSAQVGFHVARFTDATEPFSIPLNTSIREEVTTLSIKPAVALTADLNPQKIPVALLAEYAMVNSRTRQATDSIAYREGDTTAMKTGDSGSFTEHLVGFGLYYSGRRNLVLGVGGEFQLNATPMWGLDAAGAPVQSGKPLIILAQFALRYVW